MASRFSKFSQGLSQDLITRLIWFGIATAHDFESHDDTTDSRLLLALVQILNGSFLLGTCKSKFQANFHTCRTHENLKLILRLVRIIRGVVIVPLSFWKLAAE
jgi:hypothetical protein